MPASHRTQPTVYGCRRDFAEAPKSNGTREAAAAKRAVGEARQTNGRKARYGRVLDPHVHGHVARARIVEEVRP